MLEKTRSCLVLSVLIAACAASPAFARDAVDGVREAMREADDMLQGGLPTKARTALAEARKRYSALGEFEKEKVADQWKGWSEGFARLLSERKADDVRIQVESALSQAENYLSQARSQPERPCEYFDKSVAAASAMLADDENKKLLAPDASAKLQRKIDWLKAEIVKARSAGWVERALALSDELQRWLDAPLPQAGSWSPSDAERGEAAFKQALECLGHCSQDEAAAKDLRSKLDAQRKAFDARIVRLQYDTVLRPAIELWTRAIAPAEAGNSISQHEHRWYDGWESETTPGTLAVFLNGRNDDGTEGAMGCGKTAHFLMGVVQPWLESEVVKTALARYPEDKDLRRVRGEVQALLEKAGGRVCAYANKILDEGDKLAPGDERDRFVNLLSTMKWVLEQATVGCSASAETRARVASFVAHVKGEADKAEADRVALMAALVKASDEAWPELCRSWDAKVKKLDAANALEKIDAWKGTVVHFEVGSRDWSGDYWTIVGCDGIPVCGTLDDSLAKSVEEAFRKTGLESVDMQEVIGVVDGTCRARERVPDPRSRNGGRMDGPSVDGVRMRIVAFKAKELSLATGAGSSLDKVKGGIPTPLSPSSKSPSGLSSSSATGSSLGHWAHRLLAWAMSALLALAGLVALLHGASAFVARLAEQEAKLGAYPGYVGAGLVVLGFVWFASAIVFWALGACELGSLPALALAASGAAGALELLRGRGLVAAESLTRLRPLGIVSGLACFGAAGLHFLFWDCMLL